ncbi:kinase-like domain-containing protein, partial [Mycena vulgaris]
LSQALLRLSRECGLHPTCFPLSGLEKVGEQVAAGAFSDIWKGLVERQWVSVKVMRLFRDSDVKAALKEFAREALLWRQLSHPNLLPFFGLYYLDARLCLVSPWMENGHLVEFLRTDPSDVDRLSLMLDVSMGLQYLHSKRVVHGDLKGINVLVTPSHRACIADFGLSSITEVIALRFTHSTPTPRRGTVRYQAPELLLGESWNHFGSDFYAFACVCYEILTGKAPFSELSNDMAASMRVIGGHRPSRPDIASQDGLWVLIEDCWRQRPDQRPTMTEIITRLLSPLIGAKTTRSATDWDETYSSRFRRSVQQWPLLPSVDQVECRLVEEGSLPSNCTEFEGKYSYLTTFLLK